MAITPGTYLRRRREAAGLSIDDLALGTETHPHVSAMRRAEWLALIERDELPVTTDVMAALDPVLSFDREVLAALALIQGGVDVPEPQLCRVCACSWWDPCLIADADACCWVEQDLCSACAPNAPMSAALPMPGNDGPAAVRAEASA